MGGGSKTEHSVENKDPWWGQQPYLQKAFGEASSLYESEKARNDPGYTGNFVDTATPQERGVFSNALFDNTGTNAASNMAGLGARLGNEGANTLTGVNKDLTAFGNKDWTGQHIADAGRYADNPFMQGMIDASMSDAKRTFSEQTMRGIDQNAAATGNMNSTRSGVAAGIAQRGLADKAADVSSTMRGNAWQQGLQASQADQASLLQSLMGRGQLGQGMVNSGIDASGQASDMLSKDLDRKVLAETLMGQMDQAGIDNAMQKFEYDGTKKWSNLGNFYNIIGDKSWGGTTTGVSKSKETPSTLSSIGTGVAVLGSLMRCDARVKVVLASAGYTREGLPLYLVQYKDAKHLGLHVTPMAQDVQRHFPDAVKEINGILHIDTNAYDWR